MTSVNDRICLTSLLSSDDDFHTEQQLLIPSCYFDTSEFSNTAKHCTNGYISIFNTNSRSLIKNKDAYDTLFQYIFDASNFRFDILCFEETWLSPELESLVEFNSFSPVYSHKQPNKEGGGLAVFIGDHLEYKQRSDINIPDVLKGLFDCLFIDTSVNNEKYTIGVMYRSPSHDTIAEVNQFLQLAIDILHKENRKVILVGDTNINLLNVEHHNPTKEYLDVMISNNLLPKITLPTRVSHTSATLIDHLFTNLDKTICGTILTDITDHYSNFLLIPTHRPHIVNKPTHVSYRPITENTLARLNSLLESTDWTELYRSHDPSIAYSIFLERYQNLMDQAMPIKSVRFNKYKHKSQPWITKGLLKSLSTKDKLYKLFKNCHDSVVKLQKENEYKQYRNIYNKLIRTAKEHYWNNCFESSINDTKQTWKNINHLLNRTENKNNFPEFFMHNGSVYRGMVDIACGFNNYFVNVGPNLAAAMPSTDLSSVTLPRLNLPNSFALTPTNPIEVATIIDKLKPKTSKGIDGISPKLAKSTNILIAEPLSYIANLSFRTGIFPDNMKIAKVIPIYKAKDNTNFQNYRPVSLLPAFSKIFERLAYNRLYKYLKLHEILNPAQYGFQKNLPTKMAILELQNRIIQSISNKNWCIGIFLDLSKAFDTLDHVILMQKLFHYGVRGVAFDWFRSYLTNRQQCTEFKSVTSSNLPIVCGVPQGSILGPLLFLLYVNDVVHSVKNARPVLFADDTNLIIEHTNFDELIPIVNNELKSITQWFIRIKLSLNTEKTKFIIFRPKGKVLPVEPWGVAIGDQMIARVSEIKFLGVFLDEFINWRFHINTKCNAIAKNLAVLNRVKNFIPLLTRKTLYHALILPHLSYGVLAWGNSKSQELKRLKILQKRAIRFIIKAKYNSHTGPIFSSQNILTLDDIYNLQCCKLYQKQLQNRLPSFFMNLFITSSETHNYETRQQNNIRPPNITLKIQEQFINFKVANVWNSLPNAIKQSTHLAPSCFSKKCHDYYVKQYVTKCEIINCYICQRPTA